MCNFLMEDEPVFAEANISLYRATLRKQLHEKLDLIGFDHEEHRRVALALKKEEEREKEKHQLAEANVYFIIDAFRSFPVID